MRSGLAAFAQSVTTPKVLFANLTAAVIIAVLNLTTAVSIGALVFSGPLSSFITMGIGLFLVGSALTALPLPLFSKYKANITSVQTSQAPIFAAIAAAIVAAMPGQSPEAVAVTAVAGIMAATFVTGVVMYGLGRAKFGGLARYMPYPVMGGFFAGLGYLIGLGGVSVALGPVVAFSTPSSFASVQVVELLAPALVFALLLLLLESRIKQWNFLPLYLIASMLLFYAVLYATGTSIEQAVEGHWLPNLSDDGRGFFPVITLGQFGMVDWYAVFAQSATFAALALLSVIMLLLDVSGIEIATDRELDPNRELKAAGAANMISGIGTGALAFQSLADTNLALKLGGNRFLMIFIYTALTVGVIVIGPAPVAYIPTFLLGGLLIYVGLSMVIPWAWEARKKLPLSDYIVVWVILVVIAGVGILEGVGVGLALATLLFVHRYSRLSIIRASMIGSEFVTKTDRLPEDQAYLDEQGASLRIFVLQGFLFFGSASRLLEQIKTFLDISSANPARFLAIDFTRVEAMDTSAVNSFAKLMQICHRKGIVLALCGCSEEITRVLEAARHDLGNGPGSVLFFKELEDGVGWCNHEMLRDLTRTTNHGQLGALELLTSLLEDRSAAEAILHGFEEVSVPAHTPLFSQNDPGDALYLVLKGSIAILLELPERQSVMVRTMREGAIIGEMALYTGAPRTATAHAREDSLLLRLDKAAFDRLQVEHPVPFGRFHTYIIQLMADRITRANREIIALSR